MVAVRKLVFAGGTMVALGAANACGVSTASSSAQSSAQNSARNSAGNMVASTPTAAWLQVNPSTTSPGATVAIRANCADGSGSANATSPAFGTVALSAQGRVLTGQGMVPAIARPGVFTVKLMCRTGTTASTTLTVSGAATGTGLDGATGVTGNRTVVTGTAPTQPPATVGPHTGGGFLANGPSGLFGPGSRPAVWIGGGAGALAAAGLLGAVTRRRRRVPE